jgi:integrase
MESATGFSLSFIKFEDGERYPILSDADGLPPIYPTLFATVRFRNNSQAPNTTRAALDAVRRAVSWARLEIGSFEDRFRSGELLTEHEIGKLCDSLGLAEAAPTPRVASKYRPFAGPTRASARTPAVGKAEHYARITYAALYLEWLAKRLLPGSPQRATDIASMIGAIRANRPIYSRKTRISDRHALSEDQRARVGQAAEAGSQNQDNPFTDEVQERNSLIVRLLWEGLRTGELGALKVSHIDFRQNTITVERAHNRDDDPRTYEPTAKTFDRIIPISDSLAQSVLAYVMGPRRKYLRARKTPYLLVTAKNSGRTKAGSPMSRGAIRKVVAVLSNALPDDIHIFPQRFRHDSATSFRDQLLASGKSASDIENSLCYLYGWSYTSGTSSTYTTKSLEGEARGAQQRVQSKAKPVKI